MDSSKPSKGGVAGGITGGVGLCIIYPALFTKMQLQLTQNVGKNKGILDVFKTTVQEAGIRGFYKGLPVLLLGCIPTYAVRFGSYEKFRTLTMDENGNLSLSSVFMCGLGAGLVEAVFPVTPIQTINVRLIDDTRLEKPKYTCAIHGVKTIVATEGISGCYKGLTATLVKEAISKSVKFLGLEALKDFYRGGDAGIAVPKLFVGIFGGLAGGCAVIATNPVDVVKTRMQSLEASKYRSTWDCAKRVMANEGYKAFWKGVVPRITAAALETGITFVIYERIMELLQKV